MSTYPRTAWRINYGKIEPVKIIKETKMFITIEVIGYGGKALAHRTSRRYASIYDTWSEAHKHMIAVTESRVAALTENLKTAQAALLKAHAMKEPS